MQDFIIGEVEKMFTKGLKRYAKEFNTNELVLSIFKKSEEEIGYLLIIDNDKEHELTLKEFLGIKVLDLKGYTTLVPPHLMNILNTQIEENGTRAIDLSVFYNPENEDKEVSFHLYVENSYKKPLKLEQLIKL